MTRLGRDLRAEKLGDGSYRVTIEGRAYVIAVPMYWVALAARGLVDEATVLGVAVQRAVEAHLDAHPPEGT